MLRGMNNIASSLSELTSKMVKRKFMNERSLLIEEMLTELQKEEEDFYIVDGVKKKKRKTTAQSLAVKLSPLSLNQLYFLKSTCTEYKKKGGKYGKCLFGAIKVR